MFTKRAATTVTNPAIIIRPQPSWWTATRPQQQQQLQQHRYRSSPSSNEGTSTIKSKKHSRKRKLLNAPSSNTPVTTKDRIRLLLETNQQSVAMNRFQGTGLAVAPAQDLLDMAQSRLTYVRQSIYQYWNPDHNNPNPNSDTSTSSTSTSPPRQVRTYKTGLVVMDTRWWIWNILFSLLPAAIITVYCELRGKHQMYAFHHRLEVEQLQQILGEEEFTVERANAIIAARNKERDELEAWGGGDLDERAYRYVKNVIKAAVASTQMILIQLWNEYVTTNNNNDNRDDAENDDDHHHTDVSKNHSADSTVRTVETIPPELDQPSMKGTTLMVETRINSDKMTDDSPPLPKSSNENGDENGVVVNPSIEYIIQRIQQIEERLRQQQRVEQQPQPSASSHEAVVDREEENKEAIRIIAQRMKRMNQSDIQNRFEIAARDKWKKYILEVVENDHVVTEHKDKDAPQPSSSDPSDATTSSMTNPIEFFWSRYGAPLWHAMPHSWSDRLNGGGGDANESTPPPPPDHSTHRIEPPPPPTHSNVAVDSDHASTTTKDLETIPHGSDSLTGAATTTCHHDAAEESTKNTTDPSRKTWWNFF